MFKKKNLKDSLFLYSLILLSGPLFAPQSVSVSVPLSVESPPDRALISMPGELFAVCRLLRRVPCRIPCRGSDIDFAGASGLRALFVREQGYDVETPASVNDDEAVGFEKSERTPDLRFAHFKLLRETVERLRNLIPPDDDALHGDFGFVVGADEKVDIEPERIGLPDDFCDIFPEF